MQLYKNVTATVISRLTYCSPAWSGFCSAADRAWLNAVLKHCQCLRYLDNTNDVDNTNAICVVLLTKYSSLLMTNCLQTLYTLSSSH